MDPSEEETNLRSLCRWILLPILTLLSLALAGNVTGPIVHFLERLPRPVYAVAVVALPFIPPAVVAAGIFRLLIWRVHYKLYKARTIAADMLLSNSAAKSSGKLYLYLRRFDADRIRADWFYRDDDSLFFSFKTRLDEELALAVDSFGTLVCLGRRFRILPAGAPRKQSTDRGWRQDIATLMESADGIIMIPWTQGGTISELLSILTSKQLLRKTVFLMPPPHLLPGQSQEWFKLKSLFERHGLTLPSDKDGVLFTADGRTCDLSSGLGSRVGLSNALERLLSDA